MVETDSAAEALELIKALNGKVKTKEKKTKEDVKNGRNMPKRKYVASENSDKKIPIDGWTVKEMKVIVDNPDKPMNFYITHPELKGRTSYSIMAKVYGYKGRDVVKVGQHLVKELKEQGLW